MDHPMIECMERTGWPDGEYPVTHPCPNCGAELAPEEQRLGVGFTHCEYCIPRCSAQECFEREAIF